MAGNRQDLDFASEYDAAMRGGVPKGTIISLAVFAGLLAAALLWANWAKLDEVARGEGRVIPSSTTELVQTLDGGIVSEVLVRAGEEVKKGDVLVRIDTGLAANLGELLAKQQTFASQIARLRHEAEGSLDQEPPFPDALRETSSALVANELELFRARKKSLETQLRILDERVKQRTFELSELDASLKRLQENLNLANEDLKLKQPLASKMKIRRDIAETGGQLETQQESRTRIEASIREANAMREGEEQKFRQDARAELTAKAAELEVVEEALRAATDRVVRTDIKSPVDGVANKINANAVGGVVPAGHTLMEIVPPDDALLVEAKIRPGDIAFVHPRQAAVVKITGYDHSTHGGLEGEVERISAESKFDEETRENYYLVTVKALRSQLQGRQPEQPVIPGMVASVDILTGKKSVLDYLIRPVNRARSEALTER